MADNNSDDPITRTAVKNPDGSVTYKSNWSSSSPGSSSSRTTASPSRTSTPSKPAPQATLVRQPQASNPGTGNTLVRQTTSRSTPPSYSQGSREITSIAPMKTSGATNVDIKAPNPSTALKTTSPNELKKIITVGRIKTKENEVKEYEKENPGKKYYNPVKQDRYTSPSNGGSGGNSAGATTCTTC